MPLDLDELVEHWTLLDDDHELVAGKRGATRLGFALLLKFYTHKGRFPRGRGELPAEAVEFVARQVKVPPEELGLHEWTGRTIEYHRAQIRRHLGFRECSVADADKLTAWLAEHVAQYERRPERVREELLGRCRTERIEPPTFGRIDRIVASALRQAEEALSVRIASRLSTTATTQLLALVADDDDVDVEEAEAVAGSGAETEQEAAGPALLALIKSDPGNVSLKSMLTEITKLLAVRAVGLPPGLFADVAPKVVAAWRARATVEAPSHLRTHPQPLRLSLLAALLLARECGRPLPTHHPGDGCTGHRRHSATTHDRAPSSRRLGRKPPERVGAQSVLTGPQGSGGIRTRRLAAPLHEVLGGNAL